VFEPLGLLARKRQDLLATWSKIIHHCASDAGARRLIRLKKLIRHRQLQHLPSKEETIEHYDE
jgi:hypothetical protein